VLFDNIRKCFSRAKDEGAAIVVLGEMFNCNYNHKSFLEHAEVIPPIRSIPGISCGETSRFLSESARSMGIWIVGGSIPELDEVCGRPRIFNTSTVYDMNGQLVAKYRKTHLFDVCLPADSNTNGICFRESDTISPGDLGPCVFQTPWGFDIGLGICFDVRFPQYALSLRRLSDKMKVIIYPSAFNMTTGPMHWSLLARARAIDTQSFVVMASPARSLDANEYQAWGHSTIVSPYGDIIQELNEIEGMIVHDIKIEHADKLRTEIPLFTQQRTDIY